MRKSKCNVTINVELDAVEGHADEVEFAREIRDAVGVRLLNAAVTVHVQVRERITDKSSVAWCIVRPDGRVEK